MQCLQDQLEEFGKPFQCVIVTGDFNMGFEVPVLYMYNILSGECYCKGDPHCKPFHLNDTMLLVGSCIYTLSKDDCYEKDFKEFHILANFKRKKPTSPRSFVEEVYVLVRSTEGTTIVGIPITPESGD